MLIKRERQRVRTERHSQFYYLPNENRHFDFFMKILSSLLRLYWSQTGLEIKYKQQKSNKKVKEWRRFQLMMIDSLNSKATPSEYQKCSWYPSTTFCHRQQTENRSTNKILSQPNVLNNPNQNCWNTTKTSY